MFKRLREMFSIEQKGEIIVGPALVDVTEEEYQLNIHKFEPEIEELKKELELKKGSEDEIKKLEQEAVAIADLENDQAELVKVNQQAKQIEENIKQKKSKK